MMPLEQQGMSPKKRKDRRRSLEHLKMWNEFACQFKLADFKSPVYKDRSKTLEDLPNNIRAKIDNIPVDMLEKLTQSFRNRLHQFINNGG
ncbi:hypothetical protein TNCV_3521441 [Trichonephila clavipes]|nr:hypothetical protein TNCV_3521441 [Trichonephila clavipes]